MLALVSVSKAIRNNRTYEALKDFIVQRINNKLNIVGRRRPAMCDDMAKKLLEYFANCGEGGPDGESYMYKRGKHGKLSETLWLKHAMTFFKFTDPTADTNTMVHWCCV